MEMKDLAFFFNSENTCLSPGPSKKQRTQDNKDPFCNMTKDVSEFNKQRRSVASSVLEHSFRGTSTVSKRIQLPCPASENTDDMQESPAVTKTKIQPLNCEPSPLSEDLNDDVVIENRNKDGQISDNQESQSLLKSEQLSLHHVKPVSFDNLQSQQKKSQKHDTFPLMHITSDVVSEEDTCKVVPTTFIGNNQAGSSDAVQTHRSKAKNQDSEDMNERNKVSRRISSLARDLNKIDAVLNDKKALQKTEFGINSTEVQCAAQGPDTNDKHNTLPALELEQDYPCRSKVNCAFCQTSNNSLVVGSMMHYENGNPVGEGERTGKLWNVHKLCAEWAPNVYFENDVARNILKEVSRGQKLKCSGCGLKGAVLGCCLKRCRKSYHYPCARALSCRWDTDNYIMLCPEHVASQFPTEGAKQTKDVIVHDLRCRSNEASATTIVQAETVEVDSNRDRSSEEWLPAAASNWVLCASSLDSKAKEQLASFLRYTSATFTKTWNSCVTHLIVGTDEMGAARRTFKFLMATLEGKWILKSGWLAACMVARQPISEEPFEINIDIHGMRGGPKHGRFMAASEAHQIFKALKFYFLGDYNAAYRADLQSLIVAGGGELLNRKPEASKEDSQIIIIYSRDIFPDLQMCNQDELIKARRLEAKSLASAVGAEVVAHTWILDSVAAYELQPYE